MREHSPTFYLYYQRNGGARLLGEGNRLINGSGSRRLQVQILSPPLLILYLKRISNLYGATMKEHIPLKITPEIQNKIDVWLNKHPLPNKCVSCSKAANWKMQDRIFAPHLAYITGGPTEAFLPLLAFVCQNCSYVMFYSARQAGVSP